MGTELNAKRVTARTRSEARRGRLREEKYLKRHGYVTEAAVRRWKFRRLREAEAKP